MVMNGQAFSRDANFEPLTEAILTRDQPRLTDLFHQMVVGQGRSVGDALSVQFLDDVADGVVDALDHRQIPAHHWIVELRGPAPIPAHRLG